MADPERRRFVDRRPDYRPWSAASIIRFFRTSSVTSARRRRSISPSHPRRSSGLRDIGVHLQDVLDRGGRVRYLTGDYLGATEPSALRLLLDLEGRDDGHVQRRVFQVGPGTATFHPKAFVVRHASGDGIAFVGSSNVSRAFGKNDEWNYRGRPRDDAAAFNHIRHAFD